MCARARNQYSKEFKKQAVKLSNDPNVTITQVAKDLDVPLVTLQRWRRLNIENISNRPTSKTRGSFICDNNQNGDLCVKQLKQKLKQLDFERGILEKAVQIIENK